MATFQTFVCCCGAKTIQGCSSTKPEKIILDYLGSQQSGTKFDPVTRKYVKTGNLYIWDAFVMWADPDRPPNNYRTSSGKLLCQYIVQQRLGSVTKTPLRHNPMHPERKPGKMDLRIWIWNVNPVACQRWWDKHKPPSAEPVTASLLGNAKPINPGKKDAAVNVLPAPDCPDPLDDNPF